MGPVQPTQRFMGDVVNFICLDRVSHRPEGMKFPDLSRFKSNFNVDPRLFREVRRRVSPDNSAKFYKITILVLVKVNLTQQNPLAFAIL